MHPVLEPPVLNYAGFLIRLVAFLIDSLIMGVIGFIIMIPAMIIYFTAFFMSTASEDLGVMLIMIAVLVLLISILVVIAAMVVYSAWFESSKYQGTPGKILLRLKVVGEDGERISFVTAALRYILKMLFSNFFYIGFIFILLNDKKQGLYDLLLKTCVIKDE
ncbi:conserved hypothetical protein [Methanocella arvoryzae MRE50]|uniref:RDD domain-containing protein n=1 Tax=Methanocella arvoryzae (strain DSM 22066 / NBRC 105507 / MRE50) TaxID=351160 RepID=Q0W2F8_METAR|nr:conserved hypothetical protein [Methanocella arvoryzae MRE50]